MRNTNNHAFTEMFIYLPNELYRRTKQTLLCKKFDTEKKVTEETLNRILEAGRLSASSLGLQPYRVLVISSPSKRKI